MSQIDYAAIVDKFEEYLSAYQPYGSPDSLYEPIRYINELGGKRIRPSLVLMAYNLWHEDITQALPAAMAVEYFHNFSLMHDDIMDEAPLRRGRPTVHTKFGSNSAILSGDAMLIRCFDLLLEAGKPKGIGSELCSLMCKVSLEICEGQQMDMEFETRSSPTEAEYLEMIRRKTACLLGASLQIGALLAGADYQDTLSLYNFGEKLGLGFQIQDDYLDVFGDEQLTGKQVGGDILQGKKNFLYVHTCNTLSPPDRKEFIMAYQQAARDKLTTQVLEMYSRIQVRNYTKAKQEMFFDEGMTYLRQIQRPGVLDLEHFALSLMSRDH